jgi:hypothetical protein
VSGKALNDSQIYFRIADHWTELFLDDGKKWLNQTEPEERGNSLSANTRKLLQSYATRRLP